jgi:hypothetical protein
METYMHLYSLTPYEEQMETYMDLYSLTPYEE